MPSRLSPLLTAAALSTLVVGWPAAPVCADTEDLAKWWEGPVHYIADKREVKTFRALETDEDRALFVERFWARRDPTPGTISNEYRQLFWERVRDANDLFLDSHKLGWRTDRGKIYVLYGPPTSIDDQPHLKSGGNMRTSPGIIRWLYEGRPGQRTDVDPIVVVAFERMGNEYKLSIDPKLNSVFFDALAIEEETPGQRVAERLFTTPKHSELSVMLDLGKMQEVPPHAQVILERVETTEAYRTTPVQAEVDRYRHPDRDGVLAVVTVDVSDVAAGVDPAVIARFAPSDATREIRMLAEESFRIVSTAGRRVAQGRLVLAPDVYDATVMVVDPMTAIPGVSRQRIEMPGPSIELSLSDTILAAELESLRYAGLASHDEPYQIGPFRVVPLLGASLYPGDTVKLFYEVYGGRPPYGISYKLQGQETDGSWVPLGRPSEGEQTGSAQGWALPTTERWPSGAYRILIDVRDSEEQTLSAEVPFTLIAREAAASD